MTTYTRALNTGWTGGSYGAGNRISIKYTRALLNAALKGRLDNVKYLKNPVFNLEYPESCPNVPSEILNPRNTWGDKEAYDLKAKTLAEKFRRTFIVYEKYVDENVINSGPI